jgi:glycosyltransferase involved in cell wall biosynthesis
MSELLFSVIIPVFKQAKYLGQAVQSVLDQTYSNFEIVVINDASPDNTLEVVSQFSDNRIKYITHSENRGLPAARNTGIRAAKGHIIALLDADDFYHPKKLELHNNFFRYNSDIGVTYNSRFNLSYSKDTIREIWRPPSRVALADLVLGFPFSPSDMVVRKEWFYRVNLFDESFINFSEDLDINCRLALAGCQFAGIDTALNYRRYHANRNINNISERVKSAVYALEKIFSDILCPEDVKCLRANAMSNTYLVWSYHAFRQNINELGFEYLRKAISFNPDILHGNLCDLVKYFIDFSIADENEDHEILLGSILVNHVDKNQIRKAISIGYLLKGVRNILWESGDTAVDYIKNVEKLDITSSNLVIGKLVDQIMSITHEFGYKELDEKVKLLQPFIEKVVGKWAVNKLMSSLEFNRAVSFYQAREFSKARTGMLLAAMRNYNYFSNLGFWSILTKSCIHQYVYGTAKKVEQTDSWG